MLVVRIELWVGGDPSRREVLGGAAIANVTDLAETNDNVIALLDSQSELIHVRGVRGHTRSHGWAALVGRAFRQRSQDGPVPHKAQALARTMARRVREAPEQRS
jgi:hypothetical protein